MTKKILIAITLLTVVVGLTLFAGSPLSGSWAAKLVINPDPFSFAELSSIFTVNYTVGGFMAMSTSEFVLSGFIWQVFGVTGTLGAFNIQGDLLFGASTADFIYDQVIVTASIAGIDFGFYAAQLSDAVLGGPADGFAVRWAGSTQGLDIVSISEFGAQIEDEDFHGITIYHATTGLHKHYVTNPLVYGQCFTGQKITVSGWSFACVNDIAATMYMSQDGFEFIKFDLTEIASGLPWLAFNLELKFTLQTKSLVLTPTLNLGATTCIDLYTAIVIDPASPVSVNGINIYGLGLTYSWNGVSIKSLSVFNTGCYAITTPEYGSLIEDIAEALEDGHDFYPDYWELFSIKVVGDGCCGGEYTFHANTYFQCDSTPASGRDVEGLPPVAQMPIESVSLFDWGMTHIEASIPFSSSLRLSGTVEISTDGLDHFGFGFEVEW